MAGRGPAPKSPNEKVRRHKEERHEVIRKAEPLEPNYHAIPRGDWSEDVRDYWEVWATSEQSQRFTATSWQRLRMLLPIVERYYHSFRVEDMREIRLTEALLGATPADMQRLKWDLVDPKSPNQRTDDLAPRREARRIVDHSVAGGPS